MSSPSKYLEQFERVKRGYERFRKIDAGRQHDLPPDYYQDEVYAFFMNCDHLRDWIKNDDTVNLPEKVIGDFIKQNDCMRICYDICQGLKHLKRNRPPLSGQQPLFGKRKTGLGLSESVGMRDRMIAVVRTKDGKIKLDENGNPMVRDSGWSPNGITNAGSAEVVGPLVSVKYSIDTLSGTVDAFELATKCLQAWKRFIESNIP